MIYLIGVSRLHSLKKIIDIDYIRLLLSIAEFGRVTQLIPSVYYHHANVTGYPIINGFKESLFTNSLGSTSLPNHLGFSLCSLGILIKHYYIL